MKSWRILTCLLVFAAVDAKAAVPAPADFRFEVSLPASTHQQPLTGRLLLILSKTNDPEVRYQVDWLNSPPVFGVDVQNLAADHAATIDGTVPGYPLRSVNDVPPGQYYVQAVLNVYTEFHRADGHVIWAHLDQWEGQQFSRSPGNLFSKPQKIQLGGPGKVSIKVSLTEVIPPVEIPPDTEWVKHVKIQSQLLSKFWGRPMYLGAVVLLPKGYKDQRETRYPVIYQQGHFTLEAPFEFRTDNPPESDDDRHWRESRGVETGYEFFQKWKSDHFPRVIAVTFLHPTPYYDDSYAVDSANNGPYGTAIMTELIPYIEKNFRVIAKPYARLLTGGSTGGWESLALQLFHPDFFGGTWTLYPDPIDFRRLQLVNIYEDDNMFVLASKDVPSWARQDWLSSERAFSRGDDGQPLNTVRQESQWEAVFGSKGRSGGQLGIWSAVFGPVDADGYPKPLFDQATGAIDHSVALYMRDHGYDLRYYAEKNWARVGPRLSGKLNLSCGDMDNFYLNLGVYLFAQFLNKVDGQNAPGELQYGTPMKGHGWQPVTNAALVQLMAVRASAGASTGAHLTWTPRNP
jgi:hypothetical protein